MCDMGEGGIVRNDNLIGKVSQTRSASGAVWLHNGPKAYLHSVESCPLQTMHQHTIPLCLWFNKCFAPPQMLLASITRQENACLQCSGKLRSPREAVCNDVHFDTCAAEV